MELWVRSQDRESLVKANALYVMDNQIWNEVPFYENHKKIGLTITGHNHRLAQYKSKERALEVLDEIQKKLNCNKYLLHSTPLIKLKDLEAAKKYYEELNKIDLIADDGRFKIEPVGNQILIYEMPKK